MHDYFFNNREGYAYIAGQRDMRDKQKEFKRIFKNYSDSFKGIFNILSIKPDSEKFKTDKFTFYDIQYPFCINEDAYMNWIRRHAFIDIMELSRELILRVFSKLFSEEISFNDKLSSSEIKKVKMLNIDRIITILDVQDSYNDFFQLYNDFRNIRNCLNHRFGEVTSDDNPPIRFTYYKRRYGVIFNEEILHKYDSIDEFIIEANELKGKKQFCICFDKVECTYISGNKVCLNDEMLFGTANFLYVNIKKLIQHIIGKFVTDLNEFFDQSDPFKCKFELILSTI